MWCHAMPTDGGSVNLPKPFLVKARMLFALVAHILSTVHV